MSAHNAGPIRLSIANGQTDSPAISTLLTPGQIKILGTAVQLTIYTPAALTGTVTIQVVAADGGSTWVTLQQPTGTDIPLAAGKAVQVNTGASKDLRIHSSGAEGSQRDFDLIFQLGTTS